MKKTINKKSGNISVSSDSNEPLYTISTAAGLVGVSEHTLRLYEREGLIIPYKKQSGHRLYSKSDIERLKYIREMLVVQKLSIAGIKGMFSLIPCWKIIECSDEDRKNCDAYQKDYWPCWTYKHENNICTKFDCRLCEVYKTHGRYVEIKKVIRNMTSD